MFSSQAKAFQFCSCLLATRAAAAGPCSQVGAVGRRCRAELGAAEALQPSLCAAAGQTHRHVLQEPLPGPCSWAGEPSCAPAEPCPAASPHLAACRAAAGQCVCCCLLVSSLVQGLEILQTIPGTENTSVMPWHLWIRSCQSSLLCCVPSRSHSPVSLRFLLLGPISTALHGVVCPWFLLFGLGTASHWVLCPVGLGAGLVWQPEVNSGHQSLDLVIIPGEDLSRSNAAAAKMWDLIFLNRKSKALLAECALVCLELVWVFDVCQVGC